jgi:D-alanyl-D-alanine carboxypeptidase
MSYAAFVEQYLLVPNGLLETSFPASGTEQGMPSPYVEGYVYVQGALYEVTTDNMSPHVAEGNVITTPNNLANWVRLLYSGQAGVNQTYVEQMKDVKLTGEEHVVYGLGTTYTEGIGYGHNGAHIGYLTVMRYDPTMDVTVVIFSSVLNADDTYGELYFMYDVGRSAKQILGYT